MPGVTPPRASATRVKRRQRSGPRAWHRSGVVGLTGIILTSVLTIFVAFAGPSATTIVVGPRHNLLPPWYLPSRMFWIPEWVAVSLLWGAVIIGALGLWIALRAWRDGWRPRNQRLLVLGLALNLATALVPPVTSADVLMYAAYGRLQVLGRDPYQIGPADVFRVQYDPVVKWVEQPWQDTPSVYGPIASFSQVLANWLGGTWMHDIVFWLQMFCVLPLVGIGLICFWLTRSDPRAQTRALLLTLCNPCLIWAVVAGAHNEALGVVFAVAGFAFLRRNPFVAGLGVGLSGCVKVSMVFYGIGACWAYRREPRKLIGFVLGAALPLAICYGVQPEALLAATRNLGYVSTGSWGAPIQDFFWFRIGGDQAKQIVSYLSVVLWLLITLCLQRVLPWLAAPDLVPGVDPRRDPLTVAARTTLILCASWLITSGYTLSWYDLIAWVPLALLGASRLDWLMVWRTTLLSLAFVTGRAIQFSRPVRYTGIFFQKFASPVTQWAVIIAIVWWAANRYRVERAHRASRERFIGAHPALRRRSGPKPRPSEGTAAD